jgi:hypothetical protein
MARSISNSDNVIDSRDVIARIRDLESEIEDILDSEDKEDWDKHDQEEVDDLRDELAALKALEEEASASPDWIYGETLIRDSYFTEYAQQLADDLGVIDRNAGWPTAYVDWDAAADALKQDYISVDYDGVEYWIRG